MPITVDTTTDIGKVRLLITDTNTAAPLFEDDQIEAFLAMQGGNVKRAAASGLETIARSEALISKKIRTSDGLSTDGPAVAKELRESAAALRAEADADDDDGADDFGMDIVDFNPSFRCW